MEISGETFRTISQEFGYSEYALRRHKGSHLILDLSEAKQAIEQAKAEAKEKKLDEAKAAMLEDVKEKATSQMAARLENCASFLDQLREVRAHAANLLDQAEASQDMRAAGTFLKELREQIKLMAELEGRLASQPQITIINNPEWVELRTVIIAALEPHPEAREAVVHAIRK
jgi:transcriptional regulator of heat shock response